MVNLPEGDPTLNLAYAYSEAPPLTGSLKAAPEDFVVIENLGYQASGDGEHAFLNIRKRGRNTVEVADKLAKFAGVKRVAVGFAGLKDKHAVTEQSFTVQLPGKESPDWKSLEDNSLQIIDTQRHNRKIRRGSLSGNSFRICLREITGDKQKADEILQLIKLRGVPNYFGEQRFGRHGNNLLNADKLFADPRKRLKRDQLSMYLSAARSHLFNQVLSQRVQDGSWLEGMAGDVMLLAGSNKQFHTDFIDTDITQRLLTLDIHPSGPMYGQPSRTLQATAGVAELENRLAKEWATWIEGLSKQRLDADRRALRLAVTELSWQWRDDQLQLAFSLPSGSYATSVIRELMRVNQQ